MSDIAIACHNLSKRYGHAKAYALKNLNLQIKTGEIYGFLGPNGAGKSTTIRTLLNFLQPSGGQAAILGLDIVKDSLAIRRQVGYLAGEVALYDNLTGRQLLNYLAALQPLKHKEYKQKLVERFGAELHKPIGSLSKGNRQKLAVIQAFMHEPAVLILDEPTSGLDPLMQAEFYDVVEEARAHGATIFLSSHDLAEVRKMCDRVGFIKDGKLAAEKTINDLQAVAAHHFNLTFKGQPPLEQLSKLPGAEVEMLGSHSLKLHLRGNLQPLLELLALFPVTELVTPELDLEDEFLQLYEPARGQRP